MTESNPFKRVTKLKSFQGQITNEQIIRELRGWMWGKFSLNIKI